LRARLFESFPDASVRLVEMREHVLVEGQARDSAQVARIIETIKAYLDSVSAAQTRKTSGGLGQPVIPPREGGPPIAAVPLPKAGTRFAQPQVINLLKVPGPQQVLLKVRIAELNRTAFRQIGADIFVANPNGSSLVGTQIGGSTVQAKAAASGGLVTDATTLLANTSATTVFGIFNKDFAFMLQALRRNQLLKILAEPNLVALNGHKASFLAGGEFPVPIPQTGTGIGGAAPITVEFKKFGVELAFKPDILDNGAIRLAVAPSVSSIDFAIGTSIQGTVVPGLDKRDASTTVEIREGQTLAIAGLLNLTLDGSAGRIPGLGDLPVLGPFFSNTTSTRTEKELIVLVTPYLVDAQKCDEVPPYPGAEVNCPNDLEFYLHGRIEGRTGLDWRSTTKTYAAPPMAVPTYMRLHETYIRGPHGFSD
jgi:pilus assembly protein CpaC